MAGDPASEGANEPSEWTSVYGEATSATDKVAEKLEAEFDKTPILDWLRNHLGGFVYFAAQKLIDRKNKTGEERARDEAVILSCSRLFGECFAGHLLLRKGLVLQAIVLLRSAFEIATQALLFMESEDAAREWLAGRRIPPREVRRRSPFAASERQLYAWLAGLSHPNVQAAGYHAVRLPRLQAVALAYGGWFAPKAAGQIATQFLFAQIVFLEAFYQIYHGDLQTQGLLWRPETLELLEANPEAQRFGWPGLLAFFRSIATDLVQHYNSLPDDSVSLSLHFDESGLPGREAPGQQPQSASQ